MDAETDTTTLKTKTPRIRSTVDVIAKTLTILNGDEATVYDLSKLPQNAIWWAVGRAVGTRIGSSETPQSAFDDLVAGNVPTDRVAGEKELSILDQAIALVIRDTLAKREGIVKKDKAAYGALFVRATATVREMAVEKKKIEHKTREVLAYIGSLRSAQAPQSSLLDL